MERDGIDTALSAKTVYGYPFFQGLKDAYSLKKICNELYSNKSDRVISIVNYDVLQRDPGYVVNNILNKLGLSSIPQQELLDGAKDIYKEIHTWYYLNDHQPKMKGIVNKPRYPSFLKESYSHVSSKIRSNFRDYIIKKMRKYSDW